MASASWPTRCAFPVIGIDCAPPNAKYRLQKYKRQIVVDLLLQASDKLYWGKIIKGLLPKLQYHEVSQTCDMRHNIEGCNQINIK